MSDSLTPQVDEHHNFVADPAWPLFFCLFVTWFRARICRSGRLNQSFDACWSLCGRLWSFRRDFPQSGGVTEWPGCDLRYLVSLQVDSFQTENAMRIDLHSIWSIPPVSHCSQSFLCTEFLWYSHCSESGWSHRRLKRLIFVDSWEADNCSWFRNPANQLRLVGLPHYFTRFYIAPSQVVFSPYFWTINHMWCVFPCFSCCLGAGGPGTERCDTSNAGFWAVGIGIGRVCR